MPISAYDEALNLVQRLSADEQLRLLEALATIVHRDITNAQQEPCIPEVSSSEPNVEGYNPATDPLARFAGIYASDEPGWLDRHNRGSDD